MQAKGLTTEYMRATNNKVADSPATADSSRSNSDVSKLQEALEAAQAEAKEAAKNQAAVKSQAQVSGGRCGG